MSTSYEFSKNLKRLLASREMTYEELAEKLCISSNTIDYWLNTGNVPRLVTLRSIAAIFDTDVSSLTESANNFTGNLNYLLERHSMTPKDLATVIGLEEGTIIKWLVDGYPPCPTALHILSMIFDVGEEELLYGNLVGKPISLTCRNFSHNLECILHDKHLSYTNFARLIGVTHRIINLWINKQLCATDITMDNIVSILDVSYEDLVGIAIEHH